MEAEHLSPNNRMDSSLPPENENENNNSIYIDKYFWIRIVLIIIGISFVIINAIYGLVMPSSDIDCLLDKSFEITGAFNKYLGDHVTVRHGIIAFSSMCIDFVILYMAINWILWGKSWRVMIALCSFYLFRGAVQQIFQLKYPDGYLWEYPGFPSLTVSYLKTNDFFFSGHVGFPIIIAMEFSKLKKPIMVVFCFFTCAVEAFTMVVTRGHYSIDLITGMVVSHYIYMLTDKYIHYLDDSCLGMKSNNSDSEEEKEKLLPNPISYHTLSKESQPIITGSTSNKV